MHSLNFIADIQTTPEAFRSDISPIFATILTVALTLCVLFVIFGGFYYMTSNGSPEKLERAKRTLRNSAVGLTIILSSTALVTIVQNAYTNKAVEPMPITQTAIQDAKNECPLCEVMNQSIAAFINSILQSVGKPVVETLKQFTTATPLMAQNGAVFNLWAVIVAIADVLFLVVVGLIGFRIMSASVIGLEDVDLGSLLPQIILAFITSNLSIFAIDAIISISNAMIHALLLGMSNDIIWTTLGGLITSAATVNIGILLFIAVAIILSVLLLIYYLKRLIILYIGAVLSPLIVLLWLLPSFKDFAISSAKMYITTIFVLFVQVVVLMLAVSLFSGLIQGEGNAFMTALLAIATLSVLLSTGKTMNQLTVIGSGNQGMRKLGSTFIRGVSYVANSVKQSSPQSGVSVSRINNNSTALLGTRSIIPTGSATRAIRHDPIVTSTESTRKSAVSSKASKPAPIKKTVTKSNREK